MAEIPDYQTLMLPLLRYGAEQEMTIPRAVEKVRVDFSLSDDQMSKLLPGGSIEVVINRSHWAKTYLVKAGLLTQPRRGVFIATEQGRQVLSMKPERIDNKFLAKFDSFRAFVGRGESLQTSQAVVGPKSFSEPFLSASVSPEERIDEAISELSRALRSDLLDRIMAIEPMSTRARFFEKLVIRLLSAMGYGGGREGAALHLGGKGDGGVDGVIHQDALQLDPVYIQAKCYDREANVGPEAIQAFKGALDDKGATRGVFITTAKFSDAARRSGRASQKQVALIDGETLSNLMEKFNVGVQVQRTLAVKKLDEDFFEE